MHMYAGSDTGSVVGAILLCEKVKNLRLSIVEYVFLICSVLLYAGSDTGRVVGAV